MLAFAMCTDTRDLDASSFDAETDPCGMIGYGGFDLGVIQLRSLTATATDEELRSMVKSRMVATDKGIQRIDAMDEPVPEEEIEGAVHCRWRRFVSVQGQLLQKIVGAHRSMIGPDQLQDPAAQLGQANASLATIAFRLVQGLRHAVLVIVIGRGELLMLLG